MDLDLALIGGLTALAIALAVALLRRRDGTARPRRSDAQAERARAEAAAEVEEHDIEDMLNAIAERRARTGRREIGEELEDELHRGTWEEE